MNVLRRRSNAKPGRDRWIFNDSRTKRFQRLTTEARDQLPKFGHHLVSAAFRSREKVREVDRFLTLALQLVNYQLHAVVVDLQQPSNANEVIAIEGLDHIRRIVPHAAFNVARPIAEHQYQIRLTGLLLSNVFVED